MDMDNKSFQIFISFGSRYEASYHHYNTLLLETLDSEKPYENVTWSKSDVIDTKINKKTIDLLTSSGGSNVQIFLPEESGLP